MSIAPGRAAALALLTALSACCLAPSHAATTLTVCTIGAPEGFDIVRYESTFAFDVAAPVFDTLVAFKPGTTELVPALAERWDVAPDGLAYTFHLRAGVPFHTTPWFKPTRTLNADDVVWSFARMNDAAHPAHSSAPGGYAYWNALEMPAVVKSVAKVDDRTVRVTLKRREAPFLANLAVLTVGAIYSAEYGEQLVRAGKLAQLNSQPVGTGPFMLSSYAKDAVVRFVAHPLFWGTRPAIDQVVFAITPDVQARAQRARAGECLIAQEVAQESAAALLADPRLTVQRFAQLNTQYVVPNTKHRFVSDRGFREALALAFDRTAFLAAMYPGDTATAATSMLPPAVWSHDASLMRAGDLDRARQLVKASGYDGSELTLYMANRGARTRRVGELLQADWARIGVKIRVVLNEGGEHIRQTGAGEHDLATWSWTGDNGDPDNFFTPLLSCAAIATGGNKSHWCSKPFDTLLQEARSATDLAVRTALYRKAQRMVHDEVALISTVYPVELIALDRRVKGFVYTPFGISDVRSVRIE